MSAANPFKQCHQTLLDLGFNTIWLCQADCKDHSNPNEAKSNSFPSPFYETKMCSAHKMFVEKLQADFFLPIGIVNHPPRCLVRWLIQPFGCNRFTYIYKTKCCQNRPLVPAVPHYAKIIGGSLAFDKRGFTDLFILDRIKLLLNGAILNSAQGTSISFQSRLPVVCFYVYRPFELISASLEQSFRTMLSSFWLYAQFQFL